MCFNFSFQDVRRYPGIWTDSSLYFGPVGWPWSCTLQMSINGSSSHSLIRLVGFHWPTAENWIFWWWTNSPLIIRFYSSNIHIVSEKKKYSTRNRLCILNCSRWFGFRPGETIKETSQIHLWISAFLQGLVNVI